MRSTSAPWRFAPVVPAPCDHEKLLESFQQQPAFWVNFLGPKKSCSRDQHINITDNLCQICTLPFETDIFSAPHVAAMTCSAGDGLFTWALFVGKAEELPLTQRIQFGHEIFYRSIPLYHSDTVDGWNPAPVEVGSLFHYLQGFIHPRWCRISSINSTVILFWYYSGMLLYFHIYFLHCGSQNSHLPCFHVGKTHHATRFSTIFWLWEQLKHVFNNMTFKCHAMQTTSVASLKAYQVVPLFSLGTPIWSPSDHPPSSFI